MLTRSASSRWRLKLALAATMLLAALGPAQRRSAAQTHAHASSTASQALQVGVDRRIEVISILNALAGATEYTNGPSTPYRAAMVAHFRAYLSHPAVAATRALHARGIGYDAPIRLAYYLDATLRPIRPLATALPGLERFAGVDFDAYIDQVRRFATDSGLDSFLTEQQSQVQGVEQRFRDFVRGQPFLAFYDALFGPRTAATYRLAPGMVTGMMSYGGYAQRADGGLDVEVVVSLDDLDASGLPRPSDLARMVVVHELAHSYVNPMIDASLATLEPMATPIVRRSAEAMQRQAYTTTRIVLQESVVRALVVMYMGDHVDEAHRQSQLRYEEARGFAWTSDLVDALTRARGGQGGLITPTSLARAVQDGLNAFAARSSVARSNP